MQDVKKDKILIIDDMPENIDVLKSILGNRYQVMAAIDGEQGLEIANSDNRPDTILLDIMMPEMDGFEVIKRLKSEPLTRDIPVIFITAKTEIEDEHAGFRVGAADYITKPVTPSIVLARVEVHVKLSRQKKELEEKNEKLQKMVRILSTKLSMVKAPKSAQKQKPKEVREHKKFEEYFLDDHRNDLAEMEEDADAIVNMILMGNRYEHQKMERLGQLLGKYASILSLYPVFDTLGSGMDEFAKILKQKRGDPNPENMRFAFGCLESLIFTMKHWREQVFNHRLENPNVFDNSMLSDMHTILLAIDNKLEEHEGEIEFF